MNVFSRVKNAITTLLGLASAVDLPGKTPTVTNLPKKKSTVSGRLIRWAYSTKRTGIFGPALIPVQEGSHKSRQLCRARLRGLMFDKVSRMYPGLSRRDRRRHASLAARLEYRRMVQDPTNAIPDDEARLYRRMEAITKAA